MIDRLQLHDAPTADENVAEAAESALLLTAPQAARALAISPRTLWGLTQRGEIAVVRIGRSVRYDRRDLLEYLDRLRSAQASGRPK